VALLIGLLIGGLTYPPAHYSYTSAYTYTVKEIIREIITHTLTETNSMIEIRSCPIVRVETVTVTRALINPFTEETYLVSLGEPVLTDFWEIKVVNISEARILKIDEDYYSVPTGSKAILIKIFFKNISNKTYSLSWFSRVGTLLTLISNSNKVYTFLHGYIYLAELGRVKEPREDLIKQAVEYTPLKTEAEILPGLSIEGHALFIIPEGEKPSKLVIALQPLDQPKKIVVVVNLFIT
jgi:hypothetical protein